MSDKYADEATAPKQPTQKLHTLKFHLNIGTADRERLIRKANEFLAKKSQVKVLVQLRGREKAKPMRGVEFLNQVIEDLGMNGSPANLPSVENMSVTFNPKKRS